MKPRNPVDAFFLAMSLLMVIGACIAPLPVRALAVEEKRKSQGCPACASHNCTPPNDSFRVTHPVPIPTTRCVNYDYIYPHNCAYFTMTAYDVEVWNGYLFGWTLIGVCSEIDCAIGRVDSNRICFVANLFSANPGCSVR